MGKIRVQTRGKARKTFSLSADVVGFLEEKRETQKAASLTAALETLVRDEMRRMELERLNAETAAYYDALTEDERKADSDWGTFAESELWKADERK